MDNLPNDPSNPQNVAPETPTTPNSPNIPDPPNNTVDPVQSWVAQHEQRDASGRFVPTEHLKNPDPNTPNSPNNSILPLPVQITQNNKYSEKNDPPLVDVKVTNPVTYFKKWVGKLLKNQDIDIHIKIKPFATLGIILALSATYGIGYNLGLNQAAKVFFPNSSPILHRAVVYQGVIQKSDSGQYYLSLNDNSLWVLRPTSNNIAMETFVNRLVTVKGNLTSEKNVVNVTEVIAFDKPAPMPLQPISKPATNSGQPN